MKKKLGLNSVHKPKETARMKLIVEITDEHQLKNHIPEDVFLLSHKHDVFYKDSFTGELVQVLDLREKGEGEDDIQSV